MTNALSGLVGVGGLFVMGGGFVPHTLPQFLGAASVFLANLSERAGTFPMVMMPMPLVQYTSDELTLSQIFLEDS